MGRHLQREEGGEENVLPEGRAAESRPGGRTGPAPALEEGYYLTEFVGLKGLDFILRHP